MWIKNMWYSQRGKLAIIVIITALITSIILIPITFMVEDFLYKKDSYIQSYGYDGTDSSTGTRQDEWMQIDGNTSSEKEKILMKNKNYHSIDGPDNIVDGVRKSKGISYLSNTDISVDDSGFKALDISDSYDEDGNPIWINPSSNDYISAPMNLIMKTPIDVSIVLREHLITKEPTLLVLDDFDNDYGEWIKENNYERDFMISFIVFNYVSYSKNFGEKLNDANLTPVNDQIKNGVESSLFYPWIEKTFPEDVWGKVSGNENLIIDGTETAEKTLDVALEAFNNDVEANPFNLNIIQYLNDGGSYRAWETTPKDKLPPGVSFNKDEYDNKNEGIPNAFLGTASRGIIPHHSGIDKDSEEISYWGYDEDIYSNIYEGTEPSNIIYNLDDFTIGKHSNELPLATTIATDSIVFFIVDNLKVFNPLTNKKEIPLGITRDGTKSIYQYGTTWDELAKLKELEF